MGSGVFVFLIIGIAIVALIVFSAYMQVKAHRENQKKDISRGYLTRAIRLQEMLDNLPAGYLPHEIIIFMYHELQRLVLTALAVDSTNDHAKRLQSTYDQAINELKQDSKPKVRTKVANTNQAAHVKKIIQKILTILKRAHNDGLIDGEKWTYFQKLINMAETQASVDAETSLAEESVRKEDSANAEYHYHKALNILTARKIDPSQDTQIAKLQATLEGMGAKISQQKSAQQIAQDAAEKKWDKYFADFESQDKKSFDD